MLDARVTDGERPPSPANTATELRGLIDRAGYTLSGFARAMGYSHRSGLQRYIEVSDPLPEIPYGFMIRASGLLLGKGDPSISATDLRRLGPVPSNVSGSNTEITDIPLVSWTTASKFASQEALLGHEDFEKVKVADLPKGNHIALKVVGHSMNRQAPDGSLIVVSLDRKTLIDGHFYIIAVNGETTFKKYRANPARFEPDSTEPFDTIYPTGAVEVVGEVVQAIKKFP